MFHLHLLSALALAVLLVLAVLLIYEVVMSPHQE